MKTSLCFLVVIFPIVLSAQPSLIALKEIPLKNSLSYYQFFHGYDDKYSLIVREQNEIGAQTTLSYYQLKPNLDVIRQAFYKLEKNSEVILSDESKEQIFILLKKDLKFKILVLNKHDISFKLVDTELPSFEEISHLLATETCIFLGGKIKGKTAAYKLPFTSKSFQLLFYHRNHISEIKSLQHHAGANTVTFLMETRKKGEIAEYLINQFNDNGHLLYNSRVEAPINYHLDDVKLLVLDSKNSLLVGTYAHNLVISENITGLFTMSLREKDVINTSFYNLGRINNFFTYLPEKQAARQKKRMNKAALKVKPVKTGIHIRLDDLQLINGEVVLKGHSYKKIRNTNRAYSYKYQNTFLTCFNTQGRLRWNNSLTYPNEHLITFSPYKLTEATIVNGEPFFIQKQQYIFRSKKSARNTYNSEITETFIGDTFLDVNHKNIFYEQHMHLSNNGNLLYYGIRESTPINNLVDSQFYFFIENIEAIQSTLLSKGEH